MKKCIICLILIYLLHPSDLIGQPQHSFTRYTSKGEPSLKTIHQITQDNYGYIWLATWNGLIRFDGYSFERHLLPADKGTNRFISLCCDDFGDIWTVAQDIGLYRFVRSTSTFEQIALCGSAERLVCLDSSTILCVSHDGSIFRIDILEDGKYSIQRIAQISEVSKIIRDKNGHIWCCTPQGTFSDGKIFSKVPSYSVIEHRGNICIGAEKGVMLVCSDDILNTIKIPTEADISLISSVPGQDILLVCTSASEIFLTDLTGERIKKIDAHMTFSGKINSLTDSNGYLWILSEYGDLVLFDSATQSVESFYDHSVQTQWNGENRVTAAFSDRQGILWIGSNVNGLEKVVFNNDRFLLESFGDNHSISPQNSIRALFENREGKFLVASKDGMVRILDKDMAVRDSFLSGDNVYTIEEDSNGHCWFGTRNEGLIEVERKADGALDTVRYRKDTGSYYALNASQIFSISEDKYGRLWIASFDDGLSYVDVSGTERKFISKKNVLSFPTENQNRLRDILCAPDGRLFICGTLGLFVCEDSGKAPEELVFTHVDLLGLDGENNIVRDLQQIVLTSSGEIYLCTYGSGLARIVSWQGNSAVTEILDSSSGLLSDFVLSATEDRDGQLWIATDDGLNRYNPSLGLMESFSYGRLGLNIHFNEGPSLLTTDGRMFINTNGGILHFNPADISNNSYVPEILFTSVSKGRKGHMEQCGLLGNSGGLDIRTVDEIALEFQAMDMTNPSQVIYWYRMDSGEWHNLANNHSVSLKGLKEGTHMFSVRSTNGNGREVENQADIQIVARRPLFASWEFICLYLLLALVSTRTILYIRKKKEKENEPYYGTLKGTDRDFVKTLVQHLEDNIDNCNFGVPEMTELMNVSRSVLFERTKELTGKSPSALLREIRFAKVEQLIASEKYSFSQIADMAGFSDPRYFSTSFKKYYGITPSEYVKELKK